MSHTPPYLGGRPDRAAPLYGEDNAAILTGLLGMSQDEVAELTEQGCCSRSGGVCRLRQRHRLRRSVA
jgi:crotonobetainyl-CoA:carnitine CoA-transferase CaiB-like acyl-CoA transferase